MNRVTWLQVTRDCHNVWRSTCKPRRKCRQPCVSPAEAPLQTFYPPFCGKARNRRHGLGFTSGEHQERPQETTLRPGNLAMRIFENWDVSCHVGLEPARLKMSPGGISEIPKRNRQHEESVFHRSFLYRPYTGIEPRIIRATREISLARYVTIIAADM